MAESSATLMFSDVPAEVVCILGPNDKGEDILLQVSIIENGVIREYIIRECVNVDGDGLAECSLTYSAKLRKVRT